jgi:hypothetical protein
MTNNDFSFLKAENHPKHFLKTFSCKFLLFKKSYEKLFFPPRTPPGPGLPAQ